MNMMNLNVNMDTVMNRLRNTVTTVTSTVSQLSVVLPGNPVTREYEVIQHIASGGPGLMWKIYSGFKKSTKQEAAVFVFEKKQLDKWSRKDRDNMIESLKKGVNQLTRLKHPRVLTVQHPLEESRDSLAFATEPVFASLANVLGEYTNMPEEGNSTIKSYKLQDIEIKYGLLQVCEGVTFLNNDAKILHGNICPESIIINKQNSWKIGGLEFCVNGTVNGSEVTWPSKPYDNDAHSMSQQNLDYLAPELTTAMSCSPASDMFSLGMLTYTTFNSGKPVFQNRGDWNRHRQNIIVYNQLPESKLTDIPQEIRHVCRRLLSFNGNERPDSHEYSKLEYFHDEGVKTLNYLDSLFQWDNLQKSKFYKGLAEILPGLPHRVRLLRVVPCLAQEFINPSMVPFVLPNVLKIAEWSSNEEYVENVLPYLRDVMKLREPVQVLFIFMKYMELLLQKTPPDITKSDVLPLIYGSLESDSPQVQELCLSIIPSFAGLIDYPAMKNSLLPRVKKLVISTPSLSVRVNCLVCLGKILDHLDKWMVIDYILPFLTEIPSRDPAVIMAIVGIYKLAVNHRKLGVTKEIIATRILPFIFPLTIENGLTTQQFSTIMTFIYDMIKTVETEHRTKLEELGAIAQEREQMKAELNSHPAFKNDNPMSTSNIFDDFGLNSSSGDTTGKSSGDVFGNNSPIKQQMNHSPSPIMKSQTSPLSANLNSVSTTTPGGYRPSVSNNVQPQQRSNDLMSSLINKNVNQMGGPISTLPAMGMTTSTSMPLGLSTRPNGSSGMMPRSPSIMPFNMSQQPTQGFGQAPMAANTYGGGFNMPPPPSNPVNPPIIKSMNNSPMMMTNNQMGNNMFNNVMQPSSSNLPQSNMDSKNVKSLSKRDIDDFLS